MQFDETGNATPLSVDIRTDRFTFAWHRFEKRFKFNHRSIRLFPYHGQLHLLSVPILDTDGYTGRGDVDVYRQRDLSVVSQIDLRNPLGDVFAQIDLRDGLVRRPEDHPHVVFGPETVHAERGGEPLRRHFEPG